MAEENECSFEDLQAFLDDDDDDWEDTSKDKQQETKSNAENDEMNLDEIDAFLAESDDDNEKHIDNPQKENGQIEEDDIDAFLAADDDVEEEEKRKDGKTNATVTKNENTKIDKEDKNKQDPAGRVCQRGKSKPSSNNKQSSNKRKQEEMRTEDFFPMDSDSDDSDGSDVQRSKAKSKPMSLKEKLDRHRGEAERAEKLSQHERSSSGEGSKKKSLTMDDLTDIFDDVNDDTPCEPAAENIPEVVEEEEDEDVKNQKKLQAELAAMKAKMEQLEQKLSQSQKTTPPKPKATTPKAATKSKPQVKEIDMFSKASDSKPMSSSFCGKRDKPTLSSDGAGFIKLGNSEKKPKAALPDRGLDEGSDSDWDELDGEEKSQLSGPGKELKTLMRKGTTRVAHAPKEQPSPQPVQADKTPQTSKNFYQKSQQGYVPSFSRDKPKAPHVPTAKVTKPKAAEENEKDVTKDSYSGIRILKPLISSFGMKSKMEGRTMVKMSRLHLKTGTSALSGDWVTIGVLVQKLDPKTSANGKTYSIWKLNDLEDCDRMVSLFLFGEVHKQLWKTATGSVLGILNADVMPAAERANSSGETSLRVDNHQKVLPMGFSKDFGICSAFTKAGRKCSNIINKMLGEFCTYHVQAAYKKTSAKRSELQATATGVEPKSFKQKLSKKGGDFFYGGNYYSSASVGQKKAQSKVTVKSLQQHHLKGNNEKMSTMKIHEMLPEDKKRIQELKEAKASEKSKAFHELLALPTPGSMQLIKHLVKQEQVDKVQDTKKEKVVVQSIKPAELLKSHTKQMLQLRTQRKANLSQAPSPAPVNPLKQAPQLGRGLQQGDDIFFGGAAGPSPQQKRAVAVSKAKLMAIAKVKATGGLQKSNPNKVGAAAKKDVTQEKIKKRVAENLNSSHSDEEAEKEPPKKKSRTVSSFDLNSEEVKKLLKARSSHAGARAEEENEREDRYFTELERKEQFEEKMAQTKEIKVKAVTCTDCKYTSEKPADRCKKENHQLVQHQAVRRYFKCKECKHRTTSLNKYPDKTCRKCGSSSFERTCMLKEKKGPKTDKDEFLEQLRGEERKFINS